jgi:uncharacterized protein (DUF111 family)
MTKTNTTLHYVGGANQFNTAEAGSDLRLSRPELVIEERDLNAVQDRFIDNRLLLQTNVDDMNPEYCPYVIDRLLAAGASDAYWVPIVMKKGRPGLMLNVMCGPDTVEDVEKIIFTETTTLGIRHLPMHTHCLGKKMKRVQTCYGELSVKIGYYKGRMVQFSPEYAECEAAAREHQVPLKAVFDEVRICFMQ